MGRAWPNRQAFCIDLRLSRGRAEGADGRDLVAADAHVGTARSLAGAVVDGAAANDRVEDVAIGSATEGRKSENERDEECEARAERTRHGNISGDANRGWGMVYS